MANRKIGFFINPMAGMGGSVGLKGTDGVIDLAIKLGAHPVAHIRAERAFENLEIPANTKFLTAGGVMGENVLKEAGISSFKVIYDPDPETTSEDTIKLCSLLIEEDIDLLLFCGGDGTARDVYSTVADKIPILGIPAGVKMYSGVFALNPESAGELIKTFIEDTLTIGDCEILDIDEKQYREGIFDLKLFGYAKTPQMPGLVQEGKAIIHAVGEDVSKAEIAWFLSEVMQDDSIYILGPGTTTKAICDLMGLSKTLLGVDVVKNQKIIGEDVNESEILDIIKGQDKVTIIVSPLGRQGAILGRGNQQISATVIRQAGIDNIIAVATPSKLQGLPFLFVDTGDKELDRELSGYISVVCGYRMAQRKKVRG
ncbi:MAG: ATP-NAD kinase [Candidatus Syntrophoarchaeum sp. GoM_oil]|nr:MAG: ATP-NAD kinase [Candidatus Syntrophoarchaeum sp. GoM_oil]